MSHIYIIQCFLLHKYILKNNKVRVPLQKLFCSLWDSDVKQKQKRVKKPKDISEQKRKLGKKKIDKDVVL